MNQSTEEKLILVVATLASVGLVIENTIMGWEFWVPPVVILGIVSLWVIGMSDNIDHHIRKSFFFNSKNSIFV